MAVQNSLRERIARRLEELGRGPIEAAIAVGLERNFLQDILKGKKRSFNRSAQPQVARALDWSIPELLAQDGVNESDARLDAGSASVPEFDIRAGASYGGGFGREENFTDDAGNTISTDAIRAKWGIPIPFLREELRLNPARVHIIAVRGDSMNDALFDGDRAIIDLDDTDVSQGGIFAIRDDNNSIIIKQVELVRGTDRQRIRCKSRNPHYEPFDLALSEQVAIIGRVACKITRL